MTEISAIIRARLDEGRAIADEDVRALLNERDTLRAEVEGLRAAELRRQRSSSLDGYKRDDGFGGYPMVYQGDRK